MNPYSQFIHKSRYARFRDDLGRRETWEETITRYLDYFEQDLDERHSYKLSHTLRSELYDAIHSLSIMPSMRAMMTAGEAARRCNVGVFNCSFSAIDTVRSFSEILYILMCFHPDTLVVTKRGDVRISDIIPGDYVKSFDEKTHEFKWCLVTNQVKTPSAQKKKVLVTLDNGQEIKCTSDHKWLTSNRGWVEAKDLTGNDDLVAPKYSVYKILCKTTGKSYIGMTSKKPGYRFRDHIRRAKGPNKDFLHKAISKYGEDDFEFSVIDVAFSRKESAEKEQYWISKIGTLGEGGYNLTKGGEGATGYKWTAEQKQRASENAYTRTDEHREKLRITLKNTLPTLNEIRKSPAYKAACRERNLGDRNPRHGKTNTDEWKARLSKKMSGEGNHFFGKSHSEETKNAIRIAKTGKSTGENNPFFGKKHTPETREKMKAYWASRRSDNLINNEVSR